MGPCMLLELPAEIREQIWIYVVTEWSPIAANAEQMDPSTCATPERPDSVLQVTLIMTRTPIRMDRFNRPTPPAITRVCSLTRSETLTLYYSENIWECWRPLLWVNDWSQSTFIDWLISLGPDRIKWLSEVVLLYKHDAELEHNIDDALVDLGIELDTGVISHKQELSEYEMNYEQLGLPRHFGTKRKRDRWLAGNASNG